MKNKKYFIYLIIIAFILLANNTVFAKYYDPRANKADSLLKEAFAHYQKFKYQKAIELYQKALNLEPRSVKAWFWLGKSFYKVGLSHQAIYAYKKFMELGGGSYYLRRKINSIYHYEYDKNKVPYTFAHLITWKGDKITKNRFYNPTGIAIDSKENVYIISISLHTVLKFSSNGDFIFKIGNKGTKDSFFNMPFAIAIDKEDNFYITDFGNDRVQKFDQNGNFLLKFGKKGIKEGELLGPEGIIIDHFYNIYVVDSGNKRIQKFDKKGSFLMQFGQHGALPSKFIHPSYITLDKHNNIWITDQKRGSAKKYDKFGNFLTELLLPIKNAKPNGITTDFLGNIYICDSEKGVFRFNFLNNEWNTLYGWNEGLDKFILAKAISLGKDGILYVADYSRSCIDIFSPEEFKYFNFDINVDQIYTTHFPIVIHAVTVYSKNHKPILGLTKKNFRVIENGVIVSPIEVSAPFQKEDNLVLSLVIDTHHNMNNYKEEVRKIAKELINNLKPNIQAVTITSFDKKVTQLCKRTVNISKLNHVIDNLQYMQYKKDVYIDTLPKALYHGVKETLDLPWKKAVIVLTCDRNVNDESYILEECINFAKNNYVPFYIIDFREGVTTNFSKRLTNSTNGNYYHYHTCKEVSHFYQEISQQVKNQTQYFIYYNSPLTLWPNTWIDTLVQVDYLGLYSEDRGGFVIP
ncbi:MAG: tetratricopeptide repeat protein [bacterium]|nr:tetratricopeptide repeat protein [bacterium]